MFVLSALRYFESKIVERWMCTKNVMFLWLSTVRLVLNLFNFTPPGDLKSEDPANKEAGEEKAEEDNDYHRSDEQVGFPVPI